MALSDGAHNSNSGRKEVEAKLLNNNIDHDGDNVSFSFRYYRTVVMAGWLAGVADAYPSLLLSLLLLSLVKRLDARQLALWRSTAISNKCGDGSIATPFS